jgi:hypothetical protein
VTSPEEGQSFKEGKWVDMSVDVDDPDTEDRGDLVVDWYDGDTWLGEGKTFSIRNLRPGTHEIAAVVTDTGDLSSEAKVTIKVEKKEEEPGFGVAVAILAVAIATLAWARVRGPSDRR